MDTTDNNGSHLPARLPSTSSHLPAMNAPNRISYDLAPTASAVQITPQGILRGLTRNWWRILLLWAVVTAPLLYGIYLAFGPTYEAVSRIRVSPTHLDLYGSTTSGSQTQPIERFIETQMSHMLTNQVLLNAVGRQGVNDLPFFKNSTDKLMDLRHKLKVVNKSKTADIDVSFESVNPDEAAEIVNAVVGAYLQSYKDFEATRGSTQRSRIKKYLDDQNAAKEKKIKELAVLVDKGVNATSLGKRDPKDSDKPASKDGSNAQETDDDKDSLVSLEQYRDFKAEIMRKEIEADELRFILAKRQEETQGQVADPSETSQAELEQQREARIRDLFQRDPAVAGLISDILATKDELEHAKSVARKTIDPARRAAERREAELTARYENLWAKSYDRLRKQVMAEESAAAMASGAADAATNTLPIEVLQAQLDRSERRLSGLKKAVESMNIERKASQSDAYKAEVLKADIQTLMDQIDYINKKYDDLTFASDAGTEGVVVELIDRAMPPSTPTSNKRTKYLILAPAMVLCLVLGLFVLLEVKAERVADPDALSTRVQSEVYSLPPLPMVRASNRLSGPGEDDQIDRFIQRLDHLRFALCGDHPDVGLGRCVLITSAIGGEGKTTLAAQLAARCGHSGHSTLLIDADLRRGSLCPLLDVPEGLGLSDVLKEEANAEDVVIPVQGGTFHLLCAGTPVSDTSRIFQGRNFGMLIARLRQSYDLIIIDSPPVLPVPDGLILGRWTDGAVLASRYDVSRAPQVERARRQLNNAGIPVLGTVINGMKSADSYYGRYSYSRGRSGYSDSNGSTES